MRYECKRHPLQTLPTGDTLSITSHHFSYTNDGPSIYLQANLHGPEILGTALLGMLVEYCKSAKNLRGSITIVPNANPIGVNESTLCLDGRWNKKSGLNWNRIFYVNEAWATAEEKCSYYQDQLTKWNLSIEEKLAATLHLIAKSPNYVLDVHGAGIECCNYRFHFEGESEKFSALGGRVAIVLNDDELFGQSFIGSFRLPFRNFRGDAPYTATWEVAGDQQINRSILDVRFSQLVKWIEGVVDESQPAGDAEIFVKSVDDFHYLHSHTHGYFVWEKEVGDIIESGEVYITYFQPEANAFVPVKADRRFVLVSKYTIAAVGEGEQIGEILFI